MTRRKTVKMFSSLLAIICFVICLSVPVYADDPVTINPDGSIEVIIGEISVPADSSNPNAETGPLRTPTVPTIVKVQLVPNTGGIDNLHQVYIKWSGGYPVNMILADALIIKKSSILNPEAPYFNQPVSITVDGLLSGFIPVGTCFIPEDVKGVNVDAINFRAYVDNYTSGSGWFSLDYPATYIPVNR